MNKASIAWPSKWGENMFFQKVLKQNCVPYSRAKQRRTGRLHQVLRLNTVVRNKRIQHFSLLFFWKNLRAITYMRNKVLTASDICFQHTLNLSSAQLQSLVHYFSLPKQQRCGYYTLLPDSLLQPQPFHVLLFATALGNSPIPQSHQDAWSNPHLLPYIEFQI